MASALGEVYFDSGSDGYDTEDFTDDDLDVDPELAALGLDDLDDDPDYYEGTGSAVAAAAAAASADEAPDDLEEDSDVDPEEAAVINDDEMELFHHDLKAAQGFKKPFRKNPNGNRGGGRRGVGEENYSFEVKSLMGEANQAFAFGNIEKAMDLVKKVIQIEAGVYSAWKILGEIFKERGENHKCLLAWLTACHAKPKDWELWLMCAKMSLDQFGQDKQNYQDQAIYCYNRAIRANPDNIDAVYDRSLLYKEMGQLRKAVDGFLMLNHLLPNDMAVLREIAALYIELGKVPEAIGFYERSVDFFKATGNKERAFGWSELNILVELYMMNKDWGKAITTLRTLARWLYGRAEEKYWDSFKNDCEWDIQESRKKQAREYVPSRFPGESYILPLELRVKLGICRLRTGDAKEAMIHFRYLEDIESGDYIDLFQEVGDALFDLADYENAIHFYFNVFQGAQVPERKLWYNMATCYKSLAQVEDAEDCYKALLELDPKDTEALMELAAMYEVSDRKPEALELVNTVLQIRKEADSAENNPETNSSSRPSDDLMAFFPNQPKGDVRTRRAAVSLQEKKDQHNKRTQQALVKWQKLEYLKAGMEAGDPVACEQWIDTAGELVDDFRNTKALYPVDRTKEFRGFVQLAGRRAGAKSDKEKLERMRNRLQESLTFTEEPLERSPDMTMFRGLSFDTWLYIFMQYALCLTKHERNHLDAYDVCSAAKEANVFYNDKRKSLAIWSTWLACALHVRDANSVSTICRWFLTTYQFQSEVYELFTGALTASQCGADIFHSNPNQKFFLRNIKAMDEAIDGVKRVGTAGLSNTGDDCKEVVPDRIDLSLMTLYGHMLLNGKSYISALNYYTRAYHIAPTNAMLPFSIGLAYLHRCMQRQCENRHLQVLQAFTFLYEYYDMRKRDAEPIERHQEAEYNMGRALHQLGLSHLAVEYYLRVIQMSEEANEQGEAIKGDMKWEAAYNLQMVYITSGNPRLAREVTERWLVI